MAQTMNLQVDATYPSIKLKLEERDTDGNWIAVPGITGATVLFYMEDDCGKKVIDGAAGAVHDADLAIVRYDWATGDTDTAGSYIGYFHITLTSGKILIEPSRPRDQLYIGIAESGV